MFKDNSDFYPTSPRLQQKMVAKIKGYPSRILDPQGGKGDLLSAVRDNFYHRGQPDISAIEIDPHLQAILRDRGYKVLDADFLGFAGPDKFDLILSNPPFRNGDQHLLKAIDIMYSGQIICLLNAETLKNPCTSTRQLLLRKLDELGADVEYLQDAFLDPETERKTPVEVALVNILIERDIRDDLLQGVSDAEDVELNFEKKGELSTGLNIEELVAEYDEIVRVGTETVMNFYRNSHKVGEYFKLIDADEKNVCYQCDDLTKRVENAVNRFLVSVRRKFWRRILNLDVVRKRLTEQRLQEFEHALNQRSCMDFTAHNIRTFVLNLIDSYEDTLTAAVLEIFDRFTIDHSYEGGINEKNIHYINGWKTNNAFKIGKKVIFPVYGGLFGEPFINRFDGSWQLDFQVAAKLRDIDIVFNYFDGGSDYVSIDEALKEAFARGESRKIETTYFIATAYKKGTLHLEIKDKDILRRFNVAACRGREWLPPNYGQTEYAQLSHDEQAVIDSFEGRTSYEDNFGRPVFANKSNQMLLPDAA